MANISEKYVDVLEWEADVLEDREMNLRKSGEYELAEAYHRRLQEVETRLREL